MKTVSWRLSQSFWAAHRNADLAAETGQGPIRRTPCEDKVVVDTAVVKIGRYTSKGRSRKQTRVRRGVSAVLWLRLANLTFARRVACFRGFWVVWCRWWPDKVWTLFTRGQRIEIRTTDVQKFEPESVLFHTGQKKFQRGGLVNR